MGISKDHIGGLVFLCLSVAYGFYTTQIPMLPGDEYEPFHAQTLPMVLAYLGGGLSLMLLITADRSSDNHVDVTGLDFILVAKLLAWVAVFALALTWVGFLLSTIIFLMGGYWILGERRIKTLIIASVPFAVFIWFALAQLLDIYLAPGRLFTMVAGG